jgi:hypothetical protein
MVRRVPSTLSPIVGKAQFLHHVVNNQRLHAVKAEALPHLDEENGGE